MLKRYLEAGRVVSTHGLDGWVRVHPWCDTPAFLSQFEGFYGPDGGDFLPCEAVKPHKNIALAKFRGVDDIDAARRLIGRVLFIDRNDASLPEGSYFEQDLLGLSVVDAETGRVYGTLREVGHAGSNDWYAVATPDGGEVLIPAIRDVGRSVEIDAGRMRITPLKGLFEDAD